MPGRAPGVKMVGMAEMGAPISLDGVAVHPGCWCVCLRYLHFAPENPEDGEMYLLLPVHPGCPGQSPESCKMAVCVAMSISVCLSLAYLGKFNNFCAMLPVAVARFSSGDVAIRYVLPVLWMTSRFHIMCPVARRVYLQAPRAKQPKETTASIPKLQIWLNTKDQQVHIVGCAPEAKSVIYDCIISLPTSASTARSVFL